MANSGFGGYAVNIPSIFQAPGEALKDATVQKERSTQQLQQEGLKLEDRNIQQAKLAREEEAKKQLYMQEKLAPAQYATGIEMADDASRLELTNMYDNLKTSSKNMSLPDLQDYIYKKVNGIASATTQMKKEDENTRRAFSDLKKENPGLDEYKIYNDYKNELGTRYIQDGKLNPNAKPSDILNNLSSPENISNYINSPVVLNKILKDKANNPKQKFQVGTPSSYVTYESNMSPWENINIPTPASGFYPSGTVLRSEIKRDSGIIRTSSGDIPMPIISNDVYEKFVSEGGLPEILAQTKNRFNGQGEMKNIPDYNNMSENNKDIARRNTLQEHILHNYQAGIVNAGTYNKPTTNINMQSYDANKAVDDILNTSGTGIRFNGEEGKNIETTILPERIVNSFKTNQYDKPVIGRGSDGSFYLIKYQEDKPGHPDNRNLIDWSKTIKIPDIQMRGMVVKDIVPSNSKAKAISGSNNNKISTAPPFKM